MEHIVVDGCSTDGTLGILEEYSAYVSHVICEPDQGMYDAMNKGLNKATGEIIGILNSDDVYAHSAVLSLVRQVFDDPTVDSCYGDLVYVNGRDTSRVVRIWKSGPYNIRRFYYGWMPPHPTFFVRRRIYDTYGGFNLDLGSAADYEIMLRFLLKHRISVRYIPEVLVVMKSGGVSNASIRNRIRAHRMDRLAWRINGLTPGYLTLVAKPFSKVGQFVSYLRPTNLQDLIPKTRTIHRMQ